MAEQRAPRGLPVPSLWQIVVVAAAFVAAWLVWSKYGRYSLLPDEEVAGNPLSSLNAIEAYVRLESDPVPVLLPALDSQNPKERELAAYGLGKIGPAADQALDKLRERLADENAQVRAKAALAVWRISPDQKSAAAAIAPLLADSDSGVRESVSTALIQIGASAVQPLAEMLDSDETATRLSVARLLQNMQSQGKFGMAPAEIMDAVRRSLFETLVSDRPAIRLEALRLLQYVPYGSKWDSLRADLGTVFDDPDPGVRIEAFTAAATWRMASPEQVRELLHDPVRARTGLSAVGSLGDDAALLLPEILALLDDQTPLASAPNMNGPNSIPDRLEAVLSALNAMKTGARPATEHLVKMCSKRRDTGCISIAKTLHAIGAEEDIVADVLAPLLLDPDPNRILSWNAGQLMAEICPGGARRQVSLLIPKLGTNETSVDKTVLYALYAVGSQAQEAVPAVVPLLQNRDPWVAEFAGHMLAATDKGSPIAIANLAKVVVNNSKPIDQRLACANALAKIGPPAQTVVPELLNVVAEPEPAAPLPKATDFHNPSARTAIINALGRIGGDDARLIPILRSQLSSPARDVRAVAADALGRVAGKSAEGFADVTRRLRDDDAGVRTMAALAIGRMAKGRTPAEKDHAVSALIIALADEYAYVRQAAAFSLGRIGPAARAALPALRELLAEPKFDKSNNNDIQDPSWLFQGRFMEFSLSDGAAIRQSGAQAAIEQIENGLQEE